MPLNPVARAAIEELRHVTDLTPDEIVELNDIGAAQMAAGGENFRDLAVQSPVRAGNIVLRPLTCAASDFLDRFLYIIDDGTQEANWLVPFAMANGTDTALLDGIVDERDLRRALRKWARKCTASVDEVFRAVEAVRRGDGFEVAVKAGDLLHSFCDAIMPLDPTSAECVRDLGEQVLRKMSAVEEAVERKRRKGRPPKPEAPEDDFARGTLRWKALAAELGAMTGVSPDYWYAEDRNIALIAYRRACEMIAKSGVNGSADAPKRAVVESIAKLRAAVLRIVTIREERSRYEQQGN